MSLDHRYVALLRGINVGGNNLIKMTELQACFEAQGFTNVRTYIQSGNVLFDAPATNSTKLEGEIEQALAKTFKYEPVVVVCSQKELQEVVGKAPRGFGQEPQTYRYDVVFMKAPVTAQEAMIAVASLKPKEGVDTAVAGPGVIYSARLVAKLTQSHLNRIASLPVYKNMTIRNWNTTTKLLAMMEEK